MNLLKTTFIDNGIPVIVGEYGCFGKNKTRETKESYMLDVSSAMYEIGACPILWDTSGDEYDRKFIQQDEAGGIQGCESEKEDEL